MRELEDNFAHEGDRGQTGEEVEEHDRRKKKITWQVDKGMEKKVVDDKRVRHDSTGTECLARQMCTQVLPVTG